jgi:hypothetical protein
MEFEEMETIYPSNEDSHQLNEDNIQNNKRFNITIKIIENSGYFINENECFICYEKNSINKFIKLNCNHEFCKDCIKKHCLMIEGFLEEGLTLDKKREHKKEFDKCIKEFRGIFERLATQLSDDTLTDEECCQYAQEIRAFRKPLCQKYATFF